MDLEKLKAKLIRISKLRWKFRYYEVKSQISQKYKIKLELKFFIMTYQMNILIVKNWALLKNEKFLLTYTLMFTGFEQELIMANITLRSLNDPKNHFLGNTESYNLGSYKEELVRLILEFKDLVNLELKNLKKRN